VQKQDALGRNGISPLCRLVGCWRLLVKGESADGIDEYLQISESSANVTLKQFCHLMFEKFGDDYFQLFLDIRGTHVILNEVKGERQGIEIFKDPKTDDGLKKSAKGLIAVYEDADGNFFMKDQATWDEVKNCAFVQVFTNGVITTEWTLQQIRERVAKNF
jgi:hypothetical protein